MAPRAKTPRCCSPHGSDHMIPDARASVDPEQQPQESSPHKSGDPDFPSPGLGSATLPLASRPHAKGRRVAKKSIGKRDDYDIPASPPKARPIKKSKNSRRLPRKRDTTVATSACNEPEATQVSSLAPQIINLAVSSSGSEAKNVEPKHPNQDQDLASKLFKRVRRKKPASFPQAVSKSTEMPSPGAERDVPNQASSLSSLSPPDTTRETAAVPPLRVNDSAEESLQDVPEKALMDDFSIVDWSDGTVIKEALEAALRSPVIAAEVTSEDKQLDLDILDDKKAAISQTILRLASPPSAGQQALPAKPPRGPETNAPMSNPDTQHVQMVAESTARQDSGNERVSESDASIPGERVFGSALPFLELDNFELPKRRGPLLEAARPKRFCKPPGDATRPEISKSSRRAQVDLNGQRQHVDCFDKGHGLSRRKQPGTGSFVAIEGDTGRRLLQRFAEDDQEGSALHQKAAGNRTGCGDMGEMTKNPFAIGVTYTDSGSEWRGSGAADNTAERNKHGNFEKHVWDTIRQVFLETLEDLKSKEEYLGVVVDDYKSLSQHIEQTIQMHASDKSSVFGAHHDMCLQLVRYCDNGLLTLNDIVEPIRAIDFEALRSVELQDRNWVLALERFGTL